MSPIAPTRSRLHTSRAGILAAAAALLLGAPALAQEKTLRIAMTAADIPRTSGQPDQQGYGKQGSHGAGNSDPAKSAHQWFQNDCQQD